MTVKQLYDNFLQLNVEQIISLVEVSKKDLKLLFINAEINEETSSQLGQILVYLAQLQLSSDKRTTNEVQYLYTELAFYFKRSNEQGFVANCINNIEESILKNRLKAWLHYKLYTDINSHISLFKNYLTKLSSAITDGEENYENDVLRDLHKYWEETHNLFIETQNDGLLEQFDGLFLSSDLQMEFPLLVYYNDNKYQFIIDLSVRESNNKIFEPSEFTEQLFNEKFLNFIKYHPDTDWYHILLGYDNYTIRSEIIKYGQADFDAQYKNLTTSDIAKLYSYFNMRKHYYSSVYLYERFDLLATLYKSPGIVKFIDIGCGPATSGIAFTDYLHSITNTQISFDYFGVDFYSAMRSEAEFFMDNKVFQPSTSTNYLKDLGDFDFEWLKHANSILINTCYLFASGSLQVKKLVGDIANLKNAKSEIPFFILFQNTTELIKNQKYFEFKKYLPQFSVILSEKSTIKYNNKRNSYFQPTEETVYFEILQII